MAESSPVLDCGGLMPTPAEFRGTEMFVCRQCGRTCASREAFFSQCPVLKQADLEYRERETRDTELESP